jgi:PST family polysaccharide transporter
MFKKLFSNSFLKVFSYNSIVILSKLVSSFVVSKVSAIYLGPSGYAIVGNLKNALQAVLGITASGFQSGTIKYISENKYNPKQLKVVVSSAIMLSVILSFVVALLLFVFASSLSQFIIKDVSFSYIFRYLAMLLPLISLNFLVVYIFNGLQKFKLYTLLIVIGNILNALLTFLFIYYFGLEGALLGSILIPAFSFFVSLFFKEVRSVFFEVFNNFKYVSIDLVKSISIYILMAAYSSLLVGLTYLLVRNNIITSINTETAGLWEAMNKISMFYMMFFSSLFTLYLLPLLASNHTIFGYYDIMKTYFKYLLPFTIVTFFVLLFLRRLVIKVVLTDAFESIEQFFYLQLIGDFVKIIAFSLAYQFHAKKMVSFYFITDAVLYVSFYLMSIYLIKNFDIRGVFYAYIISTLFYLISVSIFLYFNNHKYLKKHV